MGWSAPEGPVEALWGDPESRAIFEAVDARLSPLPDAIRTARYTYTAWSRKVQFAAVRPVKGGKAMLGLAVSPDALARLAAGGIESWSERLTARVKLGAPSEVDAEIADLLERARLRA